MRRLALLAAMSFAALGLLATPAAAAASVQLDNPLCIDIGVGSGTITICIPRP